MKYDRNRKVGEEASRMYLEYIDTGFFDKYMSGEKGLDCGFSGYLDGTTTILDTAIGIDVDYPGYNGITLPFEDESIDYIFSSHMLEHVPTKNVSAVIQDWLRVLKTDKYIVCTVPHQFLYERKLPNKLGKIPGSNWNGGHERFYTPAKLLTEFEEALEPNSYRIELLKDNDKEFNYSIPPEKHCCGSCEILIVVKKIKKPNWKLMEGISGDNPENTIICGGSGKERIMKAGDY